MQNGAMHLYIDPNGSGYIEIFDQHAQLKSKHPGSKRYYYKEHLRILLTSFNYWGVSDKYNP